MTETIDGQSFAALLLGSAANLSQHKSIVNDLNVFPIPDGDTGENMCMTLEGGVQAVSNDESSLTVNASRAAEGMLMHARGNSGVILSQFFAGIADGFSGCQTADVETVKKAFLRGVEYAYRSVSVPTEGTILTVAKEGVSDAGTAKTLSAYWETMKTAMKASLKRTPDLLPVLKEAGVVDSGGAGLFYIVEGMCRAQAGETSAPVPTKEAEGASADLSKFTENDVMQYGYCTEFLLRLQKSKCDVDAFDLSSLISWLNGIGNSVVAVKNGSMVKIHVHTMTPGDVLNHCQTFGEFLTLKIENMTLQHGSATTENRMEDDEDLPTVAKARRAYAVVAVANGEGMCSAFRDLGADYVIDGGQGNNPSTESFITAFREVNADTVFVLPNNGNIVMAAKQAASLYADADVRVLESRDFGQGYGALSGLDYEAADADAVEESMKCGMEQTVCGMVTTAVRDANLNGVDIRKDAYIGFSGKTMLTSHPDGVTTATDLLARLEAEKQNFLIVFVGKDVTEEQKTRLDEALQKTYPKLERYILDGGQDVFDFVLILE